MPQQYDNSNSGALFRNDKGDNEKRPDYRGQAEVAGVEYWVSGWVREPKSGGNKFLSLRFEAKEVQQTTAGSAPAPPEEADDELPF